MTSGTSRGGLAILAWLQLVRLPGVITAAADSLSGYVLLNPGWQLHDWDRLIPLAAVSMILYAAGMALNDVADHAVDQAERPGRPIPSGRVRRSHAALLAAIGLVVGPGILYWNREIASVIAMALAACVVAYNLWLKHTSLGPLAMGTCRGLNFFMGLAYSPLCGVELPLAFGLFVVGITMISRSEVAGGSIREIVPGLIVEMAALASLGALALMPGSRPADWDPRHFQAILGISILAAVAIAQLAVGWRAIRSPEPKTIQKLVKTGVLSLVWIHVGLITAVLGPPAALPFVALWVVAFLIARRLYAT